MIGYVMLGTNNLSAATLFYDTVLQPLSLVRVDTQDDMVAYGPKDNPQKIELYVCKPYDKCPAHYGNGSMLAFVVETREMVKQFHTVGLANGAKNEGNPGARPAKNDPFYSYLRDIDGNKICAYCPY